MPFAILSAPMMVRNLWAITNGVTPDPRLAQSEFWMTVSVSQSIAEVARREFGEHTISNQRNHPIGDSPSSKVKSLLRRAIALASVKI